MFDNIDVGHWIFGSLQPLHHAVAHVGQRFRRDRKLVASMDCSSSGMRLMAFTNGRSRVLPARMNTVSAAAWANMSAPAQEPTAADAHSVAP
jgi:hypothetical protein